MIENPMWCKKGSKYPKKTSEKRFEGRSKRFKPIKNYGKTVNEVFIKDNYNDYYIHTEEQVVDLLNTQSERIAELENIILDLTNNKAVTVIKKIEL